LQKIDPTEWKRELISQDELFQRLGDRLPRELAAQRRALATRLGL
jgi:GTP-dependent phosphoenolpyruvate carboxykinase